LNVQVVRALDGQGKGVWPGHAICNLSFVRWCKLILKHTPNIRLRNWISRRPLEPPSSESALSREIGVLFLGSTGPVPNFYSKYDTRKGSR
jgi:hypothetical protein